jgi:hypothetical protein
MSNAVNFMKKINKIVFSHKLDCNPSIPVWNVIMNNGKIYDLNDKMFRNLDAFSDLDQQILYKAIENNKKMIVTDRLKIYSKYF